jgi:hypothetical protein
MIEKSCFFCKFAEIDPGDTGCSYLSNGDPGWPPEPAEAHCTHEPAWDMQNEFSELIGYDLAKTIREYITKDTKIEYDGKLNNKEVPCVIPKDIKNRIYVSLDINLPTVEDFAIYCPYYEEDSKKLDHEYPDMEFVAGG